MDAIPSLELSGEKSLSILAPLLVSTLYTDTVPLHVYMDLIRPVVRCIQANLKLLLIVFNPVT